MLGKETYLLELLVAFGDLAQRNMIIDSQYLYGYVTKHHRHVMLSFITDLLIYISKSNVLWFSDQQAVV